jgi:hypothetical protein
MTPDLWLSMVQAWVEVYAPVAQVGAIGMLTVSVLVSVLVFAALLLRNYMTSSARLP